MKYKTLLYLCSAVILASCVKDRTCSCTSKTTGSTSEFTITGKRKDSRQLCESGNTATNATSECHLK